MEETQAHNDRSTQLENYSGIRAPRRVHTHTQNCDLPGLRHGASLGQYSTLNYLCGSRKRSSMAIGIVSESANHAAPPTPSWCWELPGLTPTGTYRDRLASPQDILGCELIGDVLTLQNLSFDPPVPQRLVLQPRQAFGLRPPGTEYPSHSPSAMLTLSEEFLRRTNLPSRSTSSMFTTPMATACWARRETLLTLEALLGEPEVSSVSSRRRLPRPCPTDMLTPPLLLLEVAREMVTRDEELGDSLSLPEGRRGQAAHLQPIEALRTPFPHSPGSAHLSPLAWNPL